ncbi:MAG: CRISPR system precrRNA processing endoribonuclease RAMP protein Cas6 [Alphaproteobacteria bacterium]|nr:CRISPR system precrRNA processing endoribonuclease RAMP protein Cas6 [Alphaproteobacteria bacterium]
MKLALAPGPRRIKNPPWMRALRVTRVEVELRPLRPWRLPRDPAVTLRGALGSAMMELVCVRPGPSCQGCPHASGCLIPGWYEPGRLGSAAPRPVALRVAHSGGVEVSGSLRLELLIFGASPRSSLLVEAIVRAARLGLGPERVPHRVARLLVHGEGQRVCVLVDERAVAAWPAAGSLHTLAEMPEAVAGARVHVLTPVYWTGMDAARPPSAGALLNAALGRVRKLARAQDIELQRWWPDPGALTGRWLGPVWRERVRYSKRQSHEVQLSGWTGTLEVGPAVAPFVDLLAAAAVLGVGKGTTAGAGRLEVEWLG